MWILTRSFLHVFKSNHQGWFWKKPFRDWRYENDDESKPKADFVLNNPIYTGKILVAGKNFGCGSAGNMLHGLLKDYGFDVVVSSFFADIFKNNALNNFLLPVTVSDDFLQKIFDCIEKDPADRTGSESRKTNHLNIVQQARTESFDINPL